MDILMKYKTISNIESKHYDSSCSDISINDNFSEYYLSSLNFAIMAEYIFRIFQ